MESNSFAFVCEDKSNFGDCLIISKDVILLEGADIFLVERFRSTDGFLLLGRPGDNKWNDFWILAVPMSKILKYYFTD